MQEKTLLKISLIVALLGVIGLYFVSSGEMEVVESLEGIAEEEMIVISGEVGRVSDQETVVFLEVWNEKVEKTKVVLFKDREIALTEGDYVEITGTVEDYLGEKEVIGNRVVKK